MQKILVIDNNLSISKIVCFELEKENFKTTLAVTGKQAINFFDNDHFNVVILEVVLSDINGEEIIKHIRNISTLPIIVLTHSQDIERRINLLRNGADDVITKPFDVRELIARVNIQIKNSNQNDILNFGELQIYKNSRLCLIRDKEVKLSPREFELITLLASAPGKVYTREEIEKSIWGDNLPSNSNAVDVHMANMRSKLRKMNGYGFIRTIRGIGYSLNVS